MNTVDVSIIVPVYNSQYYLSTCIDSVLLQDYENYELILVDDGSTDESLRICNDYALLDKRIKVIHKDNGGVSSARNKGLDVASGRVVAFLDSDDYWDCHFLRLMIESLDKNDIVICRFAKVFPEGGMILSKLYDYDIDEWCWPIMNNEIISNWRCFFSRKLIDENNIRFDINRSYGEDQEFTYKCMLHANKICYEPEAIYYYRVNSSSAMHKVCYMQFDVVEAFKTVLSYANTILTDERLRGVSDSINYYRIPFALESVITSILYNLANPFQVINYLREKKYDLYLDRIKEKKDHWDSTFVKLWCISSYLCLSYYYIKNYVFKCRLRRGE